VGSVQPRTLFITKELLFLSDEDNGSWPSLLIDNKKPTSEQFQHGQKHLINEIDHLVRLKDILYIWKQIKL
jgi:hypothetical protein